MGWFTHFEEGNEYAWLSVSWDIFNTFMRYHPDKKNISAARDASWYHKSVLISEKRGGFFFFLWEGEGGGIKKCGVIQYLLKWPEHHLLKICPFPYPCLKVREEALKGMLRSCTFMGIMCYILGDRIWWY